MSDTVKNDADVKMVKQVEYRPGKNSNTTIIAYETQSGEQMKLETKDEPHPEFHKAMKACIKHAHEIMELDKDNPWRADMDLRRVTVSHNKDDFMQVQFDLVKSLEENNRTLKLKTPLVVEKGECESEEGFMPTGCEKAVKKAQEEATRFINGWRIEQEKSGDLFAGQREEDAA